MLNICRINIECRRRKRRFVFTTEESLALVSAIKQRPCIWDHNDRDHFQTNVISKAWLEVGKIMNKKVDDCKIVFTSLREKRRYQLNRSKGRTNLADDWEFGDALSFLPFKSRNPKMQPRFQYDEDVDESQETLSDGPSASSFLRSDSSSPAPKDVPTKTANLETRKTRYAEAPSPAPKDDPLTSLEFERRACRYPRTSSPASKDPLEHDLATTITKYLEAQMAEEAQPKNTLKHYEKYAFIDSMLKKLPDDVVDELTFDFISKIREEIKKTKIK